MSPAIRESPESHPIGGLVLPGTPTIPDQIVDNRVPYFEALDAADDAYSKNKKIDVSQMEELIGSLLANQLAGFYQSAGGKISVADTA
jgi:hypothetical protein